MLQINQMKLPITEGEADEKELLKNLLLKKLHIMPDEIKEWHILKKSLDARKKPELFWIYSVCVSLLDEKKEKKIAAGRNADLMLYQPVEYQLPSFKITQQKDCRNRPVIVGTGPCGLFCGYYLALLGLRPVFLERGQSLKERKKSVEAFWQGQAPLHPESNIQFGEGGAGTFSDGKLQTQVKDKTGRIRFILKVLVEHGAPEEILYLNKPHIGTDVLSVVVENLRNHMISLGAEFLYETKCIGLNIENGNVTGVKIIQHGKEQTIATDCCILCIGHSTRDTFLTLHQQGIRMENKPFAVGLRVQHSQNMINESQYGTGWENKHLPAADYKLACTTKCGRGVYSFCMCPGGYVVNASSEPGMTAVNGMSYHDRASCNANSAIVMTITPEDYGDEMFAGMKLQQELERKAYIAGKGRLVLQRLGEYMGNCFDDEIQVARNTTSPELAPMVKGQYVWGEIKTLLPNHLKADFIEAMLQFGRQLQGFDRPDTILCGIESRTSSPVRILRDETFQSNVKGLFPCGEGAGYAGGITSAALDGLKTAEKVIDKRKLDK